MPLADLNAVCNLAMEHLGEPYLSNYLTDTTVAAQSCRLHLPQCVETVLEGHVWSFATRCSQLNAVGMNYETASAVLDPVGGNNQILVLAVNGGPGGNDISIEIPNFVCGEETTVSVSGNAITVYPYLIPASLQTSFAGTHNDVVFTQVDPDVIPSIQISYVSPPTNPSITVTAGAIHIKLAALFATNADTGQTLIDFVQSSAAAMALVSVALADGNDGTGYLNPTPGELNNYGPFNLTGGGVKATAAEVIVAIQANAAASLLVIVADDETSDGTGEMATLEQTFLSGGSSSSLVYAPAFGSAFNLPTDSLRTIKVNGEDIDIPQNRWEIKGRYLLLKETAAESPVIDYITNDPPVDEWPTTFTDAVAFLLASRLAPRLAQDQGLAGDLLQKHEMALGKARSKDTRETRSKENHGPRQLAARSGLVQARYGTPLPPY